MLKSSAGAITALVEEEAISCDGTILRLAPRPKCPSHSLSTLRNRRLSALIIAYSNKAFHSIQCGRDGQVLPYTVSTADCQRTYILLLVFQNKG